MQEGHSLLQARLPVHVHQALKELATAQQRSVNWLVNKVLAEAVEKLQGAKP